MNRAPSRSKPTQQTSDNGRTRADNAPRRIDRLAEVVDLCTDARRIADALDERLLSYLLAMAIQETRAGMRQEVTAAAAMPRPPSRRSGKPLPDDDAGGPRR